LDLLCRHAVYWPYRTWISTHFADVESHWVRNFALSLSLRGVTSSSVGSHIPSRIFSASSLPFKTRCGPLEGIVLGAEPRMTPLVRCSLEVRPHAIPSSVLKGHLRVIEVSLRYAFGRPREHVHHKVFIIGEIGLGPWLTIGQSGRCEISIREPPLEPHVIKLPHIQALDGSSTGESTYALPSNSSMDDLRGSIAHDPPVR